ncbi:MAG: lycopene cyclase domain-containing protein [Gemmatimonadales bacterium]|jgi:lycopene cyclase domain-containing protein|nr:lycopene cyclase domain-containing protein [Gemmatimonadales bacterium]
MTYLQFHLAFILPPLLVVAPFAWRAIPSLGSRARWAFVAVPPIALLYTTPWDNYLVWHAVWFYGADRVIGTIGYVPIEEYLFFLLQPVLTAAVTYVLLARLLQRTEPLARMAHATRVRLFGATPWIVATAAGVLLLRTEAGTYLGLILAWACPVVAAMWLAMGPDIWRVRRAAIPAALLPTLYLWIADRIAIGLGIWAISDRYTLGFAPFGLPVEEATFFLVTNAISVCGVLLFLLPGIPALRRA